MTVPSETTQIITSGDGVALQFFFNFKVFSPGYVKVYLDDVEQATGYGVELNADQEGSPGGSVTFLAAPVAQVRIQRRVPRTQAADFVGHAALKAETLEAALDAVVMQVQEVERDGLAHTDERETIIRADFNVLEDSAATLAAAAASADAAAASADDAAAQVALVADQVTLATDAAASAQGYADAATVAGKIYDDTAAGLAATSSGQYFAVARGSPSGTALDIYKNAAGVASYSNSITSSINIDATYTALSGYAWAIIDSGGKVAAYVGPDGVFDAPGNYAMSTAYKLTGDLSGYVWAVTDQDGRVALGLDLNGDVVHKGVPVDVSTFGAAPATITELQTAVFSTSNVRCWGDSLTHGNTAGVTTPYPTALATLFSGAGSTRTVTNNGVTGMTSQQVASKFGAKPSILTITSNTLPASGAVTVTATENSNLSSKANFGSLTYQGTLYGVLGTLSVGWNAGAPDLPGTTTFTRSSAGSSMLIPNRTPFIPSTGGWERDLTVIWVGRNDVISGVGTYTNSDILANIALMVGFIPTVDHKFVVLGVTDSTSDTPTQLTQIRDLNYELSKKYPRNWIDIRKILVNSYNSGSGPDVTAFGNDVIPPSLQSDGLHLNDAGYAIVAQAVYSFITAKGW